MRFLTVTLNPAIDLVGATETLRIGDVNSIKTLSQHPAGKGINVAQVLRKLGVQVTATGFLGWENVGAFQQLFKEKQISDEFIYIDGQTRTNIKITSGNDTTDLNFTGFYVSPDQWALFCERSQDWHERFDCVLICGSLPQGVSAEMFTAWCQQLTQQGVHWVLDTSKAALKSAVTAKPILIKPNSEELQVLAGNSKLTTVEEQCRLAKKLCQDYTQYVLLSGGEKGAYLISRHNDEIYHAVLPCKKVVSTTGAGDSLLGSFIAFFLNKHEDIEVALKHAVVIATLVVESSGIDWQSKDVKSRLPLVQFSHFVLNN